jgi:hypothetical protein
MITPKIVKIEGVKTPPNVPRPVASTEPEPVGNEFGLEDDFTFGKNAPKIRACLLLQIKNYDEKDNIYFI